MDRCRLKNVIICILVLVNVFLLGALAERRTIARAAHTRAAEETSALFAADGIALDPEIIPMDTPPAVRTYARSAEADRQAAALLLGRGVQYYDQGGGVVSCTGPNGAALFREGGSFEAAGTLGEDGLETCRSFCRTFRYAEPSGVLDEDGSGVLTALRVTDGLPVLNCQVTFSLQKGVLTSVSGTFLPEAYGETQGEEPLSALAALTAFQLQRRETGAVASSVTGISLCYELQSTAAAPMTLMPAWQVSTDTVRYAVNCITGAVRQL